jgi:hypothetical protein
LAVFEAGDEGVGVRGAEELGECGHSGDEEVGRGHGKGLERKAKSILLNVEDFKFGISEEGKVDKVGLCGTYRIGF